MKNNPYFNLKDYECRDLIDLISCNKKFDGFNKVKLNWLDRLISKEHRYGYNRMCPFGLYILCGGFLPLWFLFIWLFKNDLAFYVGFAVHFVIGIILQLLYDMSCDKIDYNTLMDKNMQINVFEWMKNNKLN